MDKRLKGFKATSNHFKEENPASGTSIGKDITELAIYVILFTLFLVVVLSVQYLAI